MAAFASTPPRITVSMAIEPASFATGPGNLATISIMATSHATRPITIFTWPTIFNLDRALQRANYTCIDLTANQPVDMDIASCKRAAFCRTKGQYDDDSFHTLEPETPVVFHGSFIHADDDETFTEGHRYRYDVSAGEKVMWWWYGTRDDVMAPAGVWALQEVPSGSPISIESTAPVESEVTHRDSSSADMK